MKRKIYPLIVILTFCIIILSGCTRQTNTPVSQGNVVFTIEDVIVTSQLEIEMYFTNETKLEVSTENKYVIITLGIENNEDKWLQVQVTPVIRGLIDDEGNRYDNKMFVEINESTYTVEQLTIIGDNETLFEEIAPNTIESRKAVFVIPIEREPASLELDYGFQANKQTNVEKWYDTNLEL